MTSLQISKIKFLEDRVTLDVCVLGEFSNHARHAFNELLLQNMPDIMEHDCVNSHGPKFGDCYKTTSLPHVFEHICIFYISCQACKENATAKPRIFVGNTTITGQNVAKIELNYYDDIHALRAINEAAEFTNDLLKRAEQESSVEN